MDGNIWVESGLGPKLMIWFSRVNNGCGRDVRNVPWEFKTRCLCDGGEKGG